MICQLCLLMFLKSGILRLHDMAVRKRVAVSEEQKKTLLFRKAALDFHLCYFRLKMLR